jgi:hypothetical protein
MDTNFEIFKGKTFKDLCKDIYNNQIHKKAQIEQLIGDLRKMCVKIDDAPLIIPFIKDYIQAANVNDEHLIRLASIIQKLIVAEEEAKVATGGLGITDEERKKIMEEIGTEMDSIVKSDEVLVNVLEKK